MEIVRYLDSVAASESDKDKKAVNKIKQKSQDRAVENIKRYRRLQAETTKKLEKEHEKLLQQTNGDVASQALGASHGAGGGKSKFGTVTSLNLFADSKSFLARSIRGFPGGRKHATFSSSTIAAGGGPKSFSDISGIQATVRRDRKATTSKAAVSNSNGALDANSKKIKWKGSLDLTIAGGSGGRESRSSGSESLSATPTTPPRRGLIRDFQVMYVDKAATSKVWFEIHCSASFLLLWWLSFSFTDFSPCLLLLLACSLLSFFFFFCLFLACFLPFPFIHRSNQCSLPSNLQNGISMDPDALDVVLNRATSEPDLVMSGDSGIMEEEEDEELPPSIFDRKGFGELAFFRQRPPQVVQESAFKDALLSLPVGEEEVVGEPAGATCMASLDDVGGRPTNRSETWVEGLGSCKVS